MPYVITKEDPEGDEVAPVAVASTQDEARAWVLAKATTDGYKGQPFTFTEATSLEELDEVLAEDNERVIWDWNPAGGYHDGGFCALGPGSGPFHYRITEVPST